MSKRFVGLFAFLFPLLMAPPLAPAAVYPRAQQRPLYVPGQVIVKYKVGADLNRRVAALQALAVQEERGLGSIPRLNVLTLPQGTDVMQTVR
ncbi:MAG: S8 family serine peptidase, partial [Bacillota bacterium]